MTGHHYSVTRQVLPVPENVCDQENKITFYFMLDNKMSTIKKKQLLENAKEKGNREDGEEKGKVRQGVLPITCFTGRHASRIAVSFQTWCKNRHLRFKKAFQNFLHRCIFDGRVRRPHFCWNIFIRSFQNLFFDRNVRAQLVIIRKF